MILEQLFLHMAELEQCNIGEKEQVPHRKVPEPPVHRGVEEKDDDKDSDRNMVIFEETTFLVLLYL